MTLAEQIRALYGNRGDWNYGGIDRAAELADLLQKQGITDVSQIKLQKGTRQEQQFSGGEDGQMYTVDVPANQVLFGDKRIGFAGDYNNDNTFGSKVSDYLQGDNTLGWSARGHGNVTYKVGTDAQGNNYLMPEWGSSSDMGDVRDAVKAAAVMAAMAYGLPMLGGEAAAAAGAGEAAAGGGLLGGGGSALGQAGLSTALGTPMAELTAGGLLTGSGAPALLSEAAIGSGLTGGLTAAGSAAAPYMMSSADKAAMLGNAGYGPGMSGLQTAAFDGTLGVTGSNTLAKLASDAAGSTVGSTLGNVSGKAIGGLLGAVAGAANSGDKTQTSQQRLDPRMEAMLYGADGKGGYLGAATEWFNQNMGGNPLMLQGAQMLADFYKNPQYAEGYNALRSAGLGLLNTPMAGNPFMRG